MSSVTFPSRSKAPQSRKISELGQELGITSVQVDRWNAFAAALEELQVSRRELNEQSRVCGMDAPADVEEVINLQASWAQTRLSTLNQLRQHTRLLCEVLTSRQRQKANRLLQSISFA